MGLNKTDGEELPGLGRGKVASIEKWADVLGMLPTAAQFAANEFYKAGAPQDVRLTEDNILVQEYHLFSKVVFIFWLPIQGEDHYYTYSFELGDEVIRELAVTGKWPLIYSMMPGDMRAN